ncbi:MAG: 2Fe-2S iron-sulfur cluster binding domain-containing protein [bacterium]|nr:2Fe-2S iron-sulfur cluster binding domain-containing protein [bacterium]
MSQQPRITLGGRALVFEPGETLLDVATRNGVEIPTLCHDPRLKPVGACRTCLVEIEGWQRLAPACATQAQAGMVVASENERIDRHRKSLLALYMTDHPQEEEPAKSGTPNQLLAMVTEFEAASDWGRLSQKRAGRPGDRNPYIHYDADSCILCARCTRYCDEIEGVSAIALAGRGSETTISTADELSLLDTTCEICGGCIDVCPTGAMAEKMPLVQEARPDLQLETVRTTCNYCGVGCQIDLNVDRAGEDGHGRIVKVTSPEPGTTTNDGNLCVKGRFAYEFVHHGDRLTTPLVRGKDGELHDASWEDALRIAADGLMGVRERHGADGLGFVSSSRCTGEENYLVQKVARAVFGTNNVHQCAAT